MKNIVFYVKNDKSVSPNLIEASESDLAAIDEILGSVAFPQSTSTIQMRKIDPLPTAKR